MFSFWVYHFEDNFVFLIKKGVTILDGVVLSFRIVENRINGLMWRWGEVFSVVSFVS